MNMKSKQEAQNPLILRCHRLMEAFAKSDDERDFYIDRMEGFLIYIDLDKPQPELDALESELKNNAERYCLIPKLSFYETKKIMENFVNEKVYDIDTKEKLLDIIQSKEARENFLEFINDHHAEYEKWQQFYQERSRIRIIEWLRSNHFHFVFEEDLDLPRQIIEKLKHSLFESKVGKDIQTARKTLIAKAKTYYSNEALNPRPKRGRPPKQAAKPDIEPQVTTDIFTTVPSPLRPFLFTPELTPNSGSSFSSKFDNEGEGRRFNLGEESNLQQKLANLRSLSTKWIENGSSDDEDEDDFDEFDEDEDDFDEKPRKKKATKTKTKTKKSASSSLKSKSKEPKAPPKTEKPKAKRIMPAKKETKPGKTPLKKLKPIKKK